MVELPNDRNRRGTAPLATAWKTPMTERIVRNGLRRPRLPSFRRAADGSVAVEFAIVSIPFFTLLFAIVETALMFFVGQALDSALTKTSRQIRTGEVASFTVNGFETKLCGYMAGFSDCTTRLTVDVQNCGASFTNCDLSSPIDGEGKLKAMDFDSYKGGEKMVVRAFYTWPVFAQMLSAGARLKTGERVIGAVLTFQNEPF